jgi:hypothetical protein
MYQILSQQTVNYFEHAQVMGFEFNNYRGLREEVLYQFAVQSERN